MAAKLASSHFRCSPGRRTLPTIPGYEMGCDHREPESERLGTPCPPLLARGETVAAVTRDTPARATDVILSSPSTPSTLALVFGIGFVVLCLAAGVSLLRRLRQLEEENRQLKHAVAELLLDKRALQAVVTKKW